MKSSINPVLYNTSTSVACSGWLQNVLFLETIPKTFYELLIYMTFVHLMFPVYK